MAKITYEYPDGSHDVVEVADGTTLMQGALNHGVRNIVAECGGSAMCATCHVYVDPTQLDRLPPINAVEDEMLDSTMEPRQPNSRLSCQLTVTSDFDGLVVRLPVLQA